jgi:hypothetical protein
MEGRNEISALRAGAWIAGGVLATTGIIYLLRYLVNLPVILKYHELFEFHDIVQDVINGIYVIPASMASAFAVSTAFFFRKNVTKANLRSGLLAFCIFNYFAFVSCNILLGSLESNFGSLINLQLPHFLAIKGFVFRFLQPVLAFAIVIALMGRRYAPNANQENRSGTCVAIFLAAFSCFCFQLIIVPHINGYQGSFMSVFWAAHYDINIPYPFFYSDLTILLIGAFALLGVRKAFAKASSSLNPWAAAMFGFASSYVFLRSIFLFRSWPPLRGMSPIFAWGLYLAVLAVLACLTSWLGAHLCMLTSKVWESRWRPPLEETFSTAQESFERLLRRARDLGVYQVARPDIVFEIAQQLAQHPDASSRLPELTDLVQYESNHFTRCVSAQAIALLGQTAATRARDRAVRQLELEKDVRVKLEIQKLIALADSA